MNRRRAGGIALAVLVLIALTALAFYARPRPPDATAAGTQLAASGPSNLELAEAAWGRGNEVAEGGDFWGAIAHYDKALRLAPDLADLYVARGSARVGLQKYPDAFSDFQEAIDRDPELASAYYARGSLYWLLGELDEAERDYAVLVRLRPDDVFYADRYARTLYDQGKLQAVEEFYRAVQGGHPEREWAVPRLIYAVDESRGRAAAIEEGRKLHESGRRSTGVRAYLGEAYFKNGNHLESVFWLRPLLHDDANEVDYEVINILAQALAKTNDTQGCLGARRAYFARLGRPSAFVEMDEAIQCQAWSMGYSSTQVETAAWAPHATH